jgi:4-amino-4-deoxy-L-arabinose transferase-like glycosyltransferase
VTASGPGVPGRGKSVDDTPRRGIGREIVLILGIGLVARLILAYGLPPFFGSPIPGSGFRTDLDLFRYWADNLAQHGPFGFYDRGFFADYTPGYLYALWLVGVVGSFIGGVGDLIKLPAIFTDVALAYVVYSMVLELGASERRARLAALVVILNPITWFDSVVWGQVDSFGTVFLLLALRELWRGRTERSAVLAVVAALIKPQLAILVPIVGLVTIRRALWPAGGWGRDELPQASGTAWEQRTTGWIRIVTTAVSGLVTTLAMCIPFGLWPIQLTADGTSLIKLMLSTASTYSYVSVNAYNAWAMFPVADANGVVNSMASNSAWIYDSPAKDATFWAQVGPFPAGLVGAIALLTLAAVITILVARRPDRLTILVGTAALALAFFAVPTRVHERYLFPLFGLAAILIAFSWRWRVAYLLASVATFLNMYVVLTTLYPGCAADPSVQGCNPSVMDWLGIGSAIRSYWGVAIIAATNTLVFLWGVVQLRRGASRTLAIELAASQADDAAKAAATAGLTPLAGAELAGRAAPGAVAGAVAAAPKDGPGSLVPAWFDRPSLSSLSPVAWLRARVDETPIRPDRTASLKREMGGRLDKLDLWLIAVMVIAALCLRTYRLAEPARMHFDEVYHARTATEFLQDWRYGIQHDIYEWTHPHLAKYVMAAGLVAFAGHDVAASSSLGVNVDDAVIEPRFDDPARPDARLGDRVFVVTGSELVAYDLQTRAQEASWNIPGATTVAYDATTHLVTVGTNTGTLETVDATSLDQVRAGVSGASPAAPTNLMALDAAPVQLLAWDSGSRLAARMADGTVEMIDTDAAVVTGRASLTGAADMTEMGSGDVVVATLADIKDAATTATTLAGLVGGDAATYEQAFQPSGTGSGTVILPITLGNSTGATPAGQARQKLQAAIDAGSVPGITIAKMPLVAVADDKGVSMLTDSAVVADQVDLAGGARGIAEVTGLGTGDQLYVSMTAADGTTPQLGWITTSGNDANNGPVFDPASDALQMPGPITKVLFDGSAQMVEALGVTPDSGQPTVYVVEPHGNAVFADHKLGFTPSALVMDHNELYPSSSRGQILAFSNQGDVAALDIGHYDFAWRLPGVIFGALTVAALYLLTRILFRRRLIAGLVGAFALLDGMMFVQSRIGMNDVYVGFFIVAAYALFAWLWLEPRAKKWFWVLMPIIGVLLGLGLASKWVAAYAIGALGILVIARSALGRIVLLLGMIAMTAVLGWMALAVPTGSSELGNVLFPLIMIVLTLATVAIIIYRPIAWSDDEVRFAVGAPPAAGLLIALAAIALGRVGSSIALGPLKLTPLPLAFALVLLGGGAYLAFSVAGRFGLGPMAIATGGRPGIPLDPAPQGWLRFGEGIGLSTLWWAFCLVGIPLIVYIVLYIPWALIENHVIFPAGFIGFANGWPPGHTGQTLLDLTGQMYQYHNDLTSPHPASSPWWAWPLNLKPVWFYQDSFAGGNTGAIYNAGTIAIWWLSIPAMAFAGYQAYRRRSLALAMIVIGFLAQWVSWARIDRAAFQYHYYSSLPFLFIALAYLVAEIWHGASKRTWLLVRAAAALAVLGPAILWLLRLPLCRIAGTDSVDPGSAACNGNPGNLVITPAVGALVLILLVGGGILVWQLINLSRPREDGRAVAARDAQGVLVTGIIIVALAVLTRLLPSTDPLLSIAGLSPEPIALLAFVPLALVAIQVLTARDARRFVGGLLAAIVINFVVLYPNIAALPLPSTLSNWYQGVLPTYLYAFQFGVNTTARGATSFSDIRFYVLTAFVVLASAAVAYSAWTWRQALAADAGEGADPNRGADGGGESPSGTPGAGIAGTA